MHEYSLTNSKIRINIIVLITILSVIVSLWLNPIIQNFILQFELTPLINLILPTISPFFIFGILFFLFDKYLWKWNPIKKFIKIPNLNGTWIGKGESNYERTKFNVKLIIEQTFCNINISGEFGKSNSNSLIANIDYSDELKNKITYSYRNDPKSIRSKIDSHVGTVILNLNQNKMKGSYFTARKKQTKGDITVEKYG